MSYTAFIKFAPLTTLARVNDPAWKRGPDRTMYDAGALTFMPGQTSVPVLVNHDNDRVIGTVDTLTRWDDINGPWLAAFATIHDRPAWLERGTRASFGYTPAGTGHHFGCEMVRRGLVTEVSVLIGRKPAEPCAQVVSIRRTEPKPAAREQIIQSEPVLLVRPGIGQVLGVR